MHASDDFLRDWKAELVRKAFEAQGLTVQPAGMHVSPAASRRRAVFSARRDKDGLRLGFHARASDAIVDLSECAVLRPAIIAALPHLRSLVAQGAARGAELSLSVIDGAAGLDVAVRGGKPVDTALSEHLGATLRAADFARLSWDEFSLTARPPAQQFGRARVVPPPGAFLQATAQGEAAILAVLRHILAGAGRIVDLYAGCGTFTLPLSERAEMHAVEGLSAPLEALDAGWRQAQGLRLVTHECRDLARRPLMPDELKRFDAALIDPPRAGAEAQARALAASDLGRIAWVSCDPVTFARDARILTEAGFALSALYVVDQFRWSHHVETVASFLR